MYEQKILPNEKHLFHVKFELEKIKIRVIKN